MGDSSWASPRRGTVCVRLILCINTFRERPQCTKTSFVLRMSPPKSAWRTYRLSTVFDGLQQQHLLLSELVARAAALPPAINSHWATVGGSFTPTLLFILISLHCCSLVPLKMYRLQPSLMRQALRVELFTTSSGQSTEDKSSPALTFPHTESPITTQQVGRAVMTLLFLSDELASTFRPRRV